MAVLPYCPMAGNFSALAFSARCRVIDKGRRTPDLPGLIQKEKKCTRKFDSKYYRDYSWLAGCECEKSCCGMLVPKLYCFPCALLSKVKSRWTTGYTNLRNFKRDANEHRASSNHIACLDGLTNFGRSNIADAMNYVTEREKSVRNQRVTQNRDFLCRLIDVTCYLGHQELAFRGHVETAESENRGNYVELVHLLSKYDSVTKEYISSFSSKSPAVFSGMSNRIQNDLIEAVAHGIRAEVSNELKKCNFASVLVDEATDVATVSQLSIMVRYVADSGPKERFLCFANVAEDKTAKAVSDVVLETLQKLGISSKIISQSYDGAIVMSSELNGVRALMQRALPNCKLFVHCFAHKLNLTLSQSAATIPESKVFFSDLEGMSAFFSRSPKRVHALDKAVKARMPTASATRWNSRSTMVEFVCDNIDGLVDLFEDMKEDDDTWDGNTVLLATGFHAKCCKFVFRFLLCLYREVFAQTEPLFKSLQTSRKDIASCLSDIQHVRSYVEQMRRDPNSDEEEEVPCLEGPITFEGIYQSVVDAVSRARSSENLEIGLKGPYRRLYKEVLDNIIAQFDFRFGDFPKLSFIDLLDTSSWKKFQTSFPSDLFSRFSTEFGDHFDLSVLKSELKHFWGKTGYEGQFPCQLYDSMRKNRDYLAHAEMFKLVQLACTIPIGITSVERSFSTLNRIKNFRRSTTGQDRLNNLALISIEKEILIALKKTSSFYEATINYFKDMGGGQRRIDLDYVL